VTLATLRPQKELFLVDLTSVPAIPNPFGCAAENLTWLIRRNAFLRCLNEALSEPVRRDDADIEYVPTQYAAEIIKDAGYDGILYGSSLADGGTNVVLFDPKSVKASLKTQLVEVTGTTVSFARRERSRRGKGARRLATP